MTKTNKTDIQQDDIETPNGDSIKTERYDYDGFWKDLIDRFFYPLLKRAIPELYEAADRETKPRPLDKEFTDILNTADPTIHTSPHFADYVMEVPLKNGEAEWIILHCEAQGHGGGNISERMNHYKCLIYGHYRREPVALAIITEKRPVNEPAYYSHEHYGTESVYKYNRLVLSELDDDEMIESDNPIEIVLYAAKFAMQTKEELKKFNFLRKTIELLGERGWSLSEKRDLLLFTERIVNIKDEALMVKYSEILRQYKEEGKNMYIPIALRDQADDLLARGRKEGRKEGREEGRKEGRLEVARNLLTNGIPTDIIVKSTGLPLDQIQGMMN
ncbi:hypothetical protein FACS1894187_12360 [Synergistales bacterium]|nr:hypothetical protein FACS1894187_12360 [Synergistales bacterium]